ncbi:MAG TPA: ABC transporter ATP-binding protein [Syntrophaceticus sp.]|nr:ABC transporter ATP-binding protein [Syntrophaceticus sp.]
MRRENRPRVSPRLGEDNLLRLLKYLKPYTLSVAAIFVLVFCQAFSEVYLPNLMSDIVDIGIVNGDTAYILTMGGRMLVITVIGTACAVLSRFLSARTGVGFGKNLRSKVFSQVESFSLRESEKFGTPSLITRTTNDIRQMQDVVTNTLRFMLRAPMMFIGGIIMAVSKDAKLSLVIIIAMPVLAALIYMVGRKSVPLFRAMQEKIDKMTLVLREVLTGVRVVRAFNRVDYEKERFNEANLDLTDTAIKANKLMATLTPATMMVFNFTVIIIIWFGSLRIDNGYMQVGDLMAFIQYVMLIMQSLIALSMLFVMIPRAAVSAGRINEVMDTSCQMKDVEQVNRTGSTARKPQQSPEIKDAELVNKAINDPGSSRKRPCPFGEEQICRAANAKDKGYVEFKEVTFSYPGAEKPALSGISFCARPGETTAIIGGIGSGKSTLINLIPRFFDVDSGSISIDNVDIREMPQEELRSKIGYVSQRAVLFSGSIAENIRYGKEDASDEEVHRAIKSAQAAEFVFSMPDGLDSVIAQGGTDLSGGQKQRLAIARALVRQPLIYVFDDCFSALDYQTDARLRSALRKETADSTVIIVAQRVSTVMGADQIIVLDDGRVVGAGRHKELLDTCSVYREIMSSQLALEELA